MSSLKNERKPLKTSKTLALHSLSITCGLAPLGHVPCGPIRFVSKGKGVDPCKSKKGTSLLLKTHFGLILDASRRNLEVASSLLGGSCIP